MIPTEILETRPPKAPRRSKRKFDSMVQNPFDDPFCQICVFDHLWSRRLSKIKIDARIAV